MPYVYTNPQGAAGLFVIEGAHRGILLLLLHRPAKRRRVLSALAWSASAEGLRSTGHALTTHRSCATPKNCALRRASRQCYSLVLCIPGLCGWCNKSTLCKGQQKEGTTAPYKKHYPTPSAQCALFPPTRPPQRATPSSFRVHTSLCLGSYTSEGRASRHIRPSSNMYT